MATERIGMGALIFLAYLSQPIAAMISPFFLGMIADHAGMERELPGWTIGVTAWMSTGQMTEVIFMLLMPLV